MTTSPALPRLYGIANCDTVKKARAWFRQQGCDVPFHDFKKSGVPVDRLDAWIGALGWERLVNRSGSTWRQLDEPLRAAVVDATSAKRLMLAQSSVIKRPVVEWPSGEVTVGFDAGEWSRR